jgi:hypothetical protein
MDCMNKGPMRQLHVGQEKNGGVSGRNRVNSAFREDSDAGASIRRCKIQRRWRHRVCVMIGEDIEGWVMQTQRQASTPMHVKEYGDQ